MSKKLLKIAGLVMMASLLFTMGCEKDKNDSAKLPPMESFVLNTDEFNEAKSAEIIPTNFQLAVLGVNYWNTILAVNLAVPVAAYAKALEQDPVELGDNSWLWSYNVTVNEVVYTAELYAEVGEDSISMEMYVSQESGFDNFLWFTGKCDRARTNGEWTIYLNPASPAAYISIEWNYDWDDLTWNVRYTNILAGNDYIDSYIEYGKTLDPIYDVYYDIWDSFNLEEYSIEVNTTTHAGRVLYNEAWHCWDSSHADIACP
jgi:hypothetical protein